MKNSKRFIPPLQSTDLDTSSMPDISSEDLKEFKTSLAYKKYVRPIVEQDRKAKRSSRINWWKSNIIPLLGLIFAFISALPAIIDFIEYIQAKIM